ncbi:hypothetical protein W911_12655 [Hyphomicrobium nitrativorans NL23]|uniref:Uncharacterized protein n=2 Tax=Hyphomicrobium TaxID=81 RepID=V5SID7_9HYPH|nr:hypothetical protein W911_12655 [Hyphomicrobium nitrativorans NL23]
MIRTASTVSRLSAFGLGLTMSLLATQAGAATEAHDALRACRNVADDAGRLACYDREVVRLSAPRFSGRLGRVTDPFEIDGPAVLRFQSDGAIFVLYLKSADGEVLQNLHLGGGGEATYRIESPGTYVLDINGSESWRIWLEPINETRIN